VEPAGIVLLLVFPVGPLLLGLYSWRKSRASNPSTEGTKVDSWPGILNASLYYALAFNLVYFVQEFFLAWPKSLLPGVGAVVYHNNHNWSGDHPEVILYQGAGAVAIVVLGIVLTAIGSISRSAFGRWNPLLWWSACMALGLGLVQFSIAAMHPDNDVGQAFDYLALSSQSRLAIAVIAAALTIAFGIFFARPILSLAPEGSIKSARNRVIYVLKFAIVPILVGSVIAFANRAPPMGHLTMPIFTGLFVLPWTLAAAALTPTQKPVKNRLHDGIDWQVIIVSVFVLLIFRTILANGLAV
jgi:hypothetical protein